MTVDKGPGTGERAPTGIQMCIPHMPRMRHMRPYFQRYRNIGRSGCGGKARRISKQRFRRADLNQSGRESSKIGIKRGYAGILRSMPAGT